MFDNNVAHQKLKESDKVGSLPYYPKTQKFWSGSAARASRADFGKAESTIQWIKDNSELQTATHKEHFKYKAWRFEFTYVQKIHSVFSRKTDNMLLLSEYQDSSWRWFFKPAELHRSNLFSKHRVQSATELCMCRVQEKALQYKVQTNTWSCLCPGRWFNIQLKLLCSSASTCYTPAI